MDYRPSRTDLLPISTNLNGKRLTPQGYRLPSFTANIGYRHRFHGRLSAVLSMFDIFNSQRERSVIDTATLIDTSTRRNTRRIVSLALSVPFGGGRSNSDAAIDFGD